MSISKKESARSKSSKKPKDAVLRPRTAYNFFYKYQRDLIVKSRALSQSNDGQEVLSNTMPIPCSWLSTSSRKRRPHRKTHGLIGFEQLTKKVAKCWRELDANTRNKFITLAEQDKIRYKKETLAHFPASVQQNNITDYRMSLQYAKVARSNQENMHCRMNVGIRTNSNCFSSDGYIPQPDQPAYEPVNLKGKPEIRPNFCASHDAIPIRIESNEDNLSEEEYDMIELLIQE